MYIPTSLADQIIEIVTDPWPPYAYEENGRIQGTDVETSLAVFSEMGLKADIKLLPWKRCLALVKAKQADAILAASITPERKEFLHFPKEPVSTGITVFFKKAGDPINSVDLSGSSSQKAGATLGYKYCKRIDSSPLIRQAARVQSLEQNFTKLLRGRLDLVVASEAVGRFKILQMGVADKISVIPDHEYCHGGNYLAFSKRSGNDELSRRFNEALKKFKKNDKYQDILLRYGQSR